MAAAGVPGSLIIALLALAIGGRHGASAIVYGLCAALCGVEAIVALAILLGGAPTAELTLPIGLPWHGAHLRIDALSAFFMAVVNFGGLAASVYAIGYGAHEREPKRVLPFYCAFIAGMNLVVVAHDAFSFLVGWEMMSLASWALVISNHHDAENRRAGFVYLVMASFGALALLIGFALLAGGSGDVTFAGLRQASPTAAIAGVVVVFAFLGAGSKAGLAPLHVWLPLAHPAAPSHVSALMSGVMTKVAVYGFIRIVFDLLPGPAPWWSLAALLLGGLTAVLGILQATQESDLKKLLAYSTIENIGVIFIGLGLSLAFKANGIDWAAALALTAALFHVLNHSLFKSLLFFGAGAVVNATGERNIETLGGLIHRMPKTAIVLLCGCMAASALPPLNGFASEWLMFQSVLVSPVLPQWGLKLAVPAVGAALALSAALCAACFIRLYGIAFLGRARTPAAAECGETDAWSMAAMILLAVLCVALGVLPGLVIDALAPVVTALTGARMPAQSDAWMSVVPIAQARSSYNGLLVFVFVAASTLLVVQIIHRFASKASRRGPAWDCGFPEQPPTTQYTASSFAQPIRRVFGAFALGARDRVDMPAPGERRAAQLLLTLRDFAWEYIYLSIERGVQATADLFNRVHALTIRGYLALVFSGLVLLLFGVAVWA